jgi:hypothetical protein
LEPNTVVRWIALFCLVALVACQAPAPAAPTAVPQLTVQAVKPSVAPSPVVAASPSPLAAPSPSPLAAPSPSAAAAAPAVGSSRVEVLNAADAAFGRGDLTDAGQLYARVLNTPPTGETAQQTAAINDLAHFRAMIVLLANGQEDQARAQLTALQQQDANAPLARIASQVWDQYSMVGAVRGACAQVQPQIATQAGSTLQTLQGMGVSVDATTLCSVPRG